MFASLSALDCDYLVGTRDRASEIDEPQQSCSVLSTFRYRLLEASPLVSTVFQASILCARGFVYRRQIASTPRRGENICSRVSSLMGSYELCSTEDILVTVPYYLRKNGGTDV